MSDLHVGNRTVGGAAWTPSVSPREGSKNADFPRSSAPGCAHTPTPGPQGPAQSWMQQVPNKCLWVAVSSPGASVKCLPPARDLGRPQRTPHPDPGRPSLGPLWPRSHEGKGLL